MTIVHGLALSLNRTAEAGAEVRAIGLRLPSLTSALSSPPHETKQPGRPETELRDDLFDFF
jgi:hypothetical protein